MDSDDLEREAIALVKQYGFLLPGSVKDFLRRVAARMGWQQFKV